MWKMRGLVVALSVLVGSMMTVNPAYAHARRQPRHHTQPAHKRPWDSVKNAIAFCESGGRYTARSRRSSASGKYQFLRSTWAGRYGVREAYLATPDQQEAAAEALYSAAGTRPWRASQRCWGHKSS